MESLIVEVQLILPTSMAAWPHNRSLLLGIEALPPKNEKYFNIKLPYYIIMLLLKYLEIYTVV